MTQNSTSNLKYFMGWLAVTNNIEWGPYICKQLNILSLLELSPCHNYMENFQPFWARSGLANSEISPLLGSRFEFKTSRLNPSPNVALCKVI